MATISTTIRKNEKKADGTFNVKIRIWHCKKSSYIDTTHFVTNKQVGKKNKSSDTLIVKDNFILDRIAPDLKKYRDWISENAAFINRLTAIELKEKLLNIDNHKNADTNIDFLAFCNDFIFAKQNSPKASSSRTLSTVRNSLRDYFNSPYIPITEINFNFLKRYELYLRSERELTRKNGSESRTYIQKGVSDSGLHNHMRDLRLLFNEARNHFNDEDLGIIRIFHYPFKKYKIGSAPITPHRDRPISDIVALRDATLPKDSRAELARDLCMLSFYLLGMNAADLYELPTAEQIDKRINYNRAKTRGKRKDKALFSVKVIKEARPLINKYAGLLQKRYSTTQGLNTAIDKGLKIVSEVTGILNLDFYDIRHCVGTWARRKCGYSKDDVAEALNQTDRTVTDTYISQDWSLIDRIQTDLVNLLAEN